MDALTKLLSVATAGNGAVAAGSLVLLVLGVLFIRAFCRSVFRVDEQMDLLRDMHEQLHALILKTPSAPAPVPEKLAEAPRMFRRAAADIPPLLREEIERPKVAPQPPAPAAPDEDVLNLWRSGIGSGDAELSRPATAPTTPPAPVQRPKPRTIDSGDEAPRARRFTLPPL
jgi:hypothetical protein